MGFGPVGVPGFFGPGIDLGIHAFVLSPSLDVIEPGPSLRDGAEVSGDIDALTAGIGRSVEGLAADGVTRVVLRLPAPAPGMVTFSVRDEEGSTDFERVGLIGPAGAPGASSPFQALTETTSDGRHVAVAVLQAPLDFVRPGLDENGDGQDDDECRLSRPLIVRRTTHRTRAAATADNPGRSRARWSCTGRP